MTFCVFDKLPAPLLRRVVRRWGRDGNDSDWPALLYMPAALPRCYRLWMACQSMRALPPSPVVILCAERQPSPPRFPSVCLAHTHTSLLLYLCASSISPSPLASFVHLSSSSRHASAPPPNTPTHTHRTCGVPGMLLAYDNHSCSRVARKQEAEGGWGEDNFFKLPVWLRHICVSLWLHSHSRPPIPPPPPQYTHTHPFPHLGWLGSNAMLAAGRPGDHFIIGRGRVWRKGRYRKGWCHLVCQALYFLFFLLLLSIHPVSAAEGSHKHARMYTY